MICEEYKWEQVEPGRMEGHKWIKAINKRVPTGRKVEVKGYTSAGAYEDDTYPIAIIVDEEGFLTECPIELLKPL